MGNFYNYKKRTGCTIPDEYQGIIKFALASKKLLICLRGGSIHIYYRGGKILDLKGKSLKFDVKYLPKQDDIDEKLKWLHSFTKDDVINNPQKYFKDAQKVMDLWFKKNKKQEREDQQSIAENNQDYPQLGSLAVVDIEYSVSFHSNCYNETYIKKLGRDYKRYPNPRFDIIAIDENGQLYVLELKTGLDSTKNCETHITDFVAMIGSHCKRDDTAKKELRWQTFAEEIADMIEQLNEHKYRKNKLPKVDLDLPPVFMFAFTVEREPKHKEDTPENQRCKFAEIVNNAIEKAIENSNERGLDNEVRDLLEKGCIRRDILYVDADFKLSL